MHWTTTRWRTSKRGCRTAKRGDDFLETAGSVKKLLPMTEWERERFEKEWDSARNKILEMIRGGERRSGEKESSGRRFS